MFVKERLEKEEVCTYTTCIMSILHHKIQQIYNERKVSQNEQEKRGIIWKNMWGE